MYNIAYIPLFKDFLANLKDVDMKNYMTLKLNEVKFQYFSSESNLSDYLPLIHNEYNTIFSNSPYLNYKNINLSNTSDILGNKRIRQLTPTKNSFSACTPYSNTPFSPFRFVQEQKFSKPKVNMKRITFDSCFAENSILIEMSKKVIYHFTKGRKR